MPELDKREEGSMSGKVITFGKHKGKSIDDVLIGDPAYLQWLAGQAWFRERHVALYQTVINFGAEPSETPDHNALQVLFLEDAFCLRFAQFVTKGFRRATVEDVQTTRSFESMGVDVKLQITDQRKPPKGEQSAELVAALAAHKAIVARRPGDRASKDELTAFALEIGGVTRVDDVGLMFEIRRTLQVRQFALEEQIRKADDEARRIWREACGCWQINLSIEIKPSVGDDYPAVLRQMRTNRSDCLFVETYTGTGATEAQFVATLFNSGIKVVFRRDLGGA